MDGMLSSIEEALNANIWQPALALSLCLPDILGQIEYPQLAGPGNVGARYKQWFDAWVVPKLFAGEWSHRQGVMTGEDGYAFRCSYLHVGDNTVTRSQWRLIHPTPADLGHLSTEEIFEVKAVLHVATNLFCRAVCDAARAWREDILQRRPETKNDLDGLLYIKQGEASIGYSIDFGHFIAGASSTFY